MSFYVTFICVSMKSSKGQEIRSCDICAVSLSFEYIDSVQQSFLTEQGAGCQRSSGLTSPSLILDNYILPIKSEY